MNNIKSTNLSIQNPLVSPSTALSETPPHATVLEEVGLLRDNSSSGADVDVAGAEIM